MSEKSERTHEGIAAGGARSAPRARGLRRDGLQHLIDVLVAEGYRVLGPRVRDGAIGCGPVSRVEQLPIGWRDVQAPGRYRLERRGDDAVFGFVVGPESPKRELHAPVERLFQLRRKERSFEAVPQALPQGKTAILGVRGCEIAAIGVQDRVLLEGAFVDPRYAARRADLLLVGVSCAEPGGTCFCASVGTGPRPESGFDVSLTELDPDRAEQHRFLVEVGSEAGAAIVDALGLEAARVEDEAAATEQSVEAAKRMGRTLEVDGVRELLAASPEHPRWKEVAERCLTCANCTMVCPTCFCTRVDDVTSLDGNTAERVKRWDSCFSLDYSYMHGGEVRSSAESRYRQWLTHKLSSWFDQFDESGCVGCGRCITWCPAGIDITEEVVAMRQAPTKEEAS